VLRYRQARRVIDLLVALLALPLVLPLLGAVIVAIQFSSPGPVLFRQRRGGLDGMEFTMVKLRTMSRIARAEFEPRVSRAVTSDGTEEPTRDGDARTTAVTRWVRRHRLDELPQLWHVLTGEMGLIGPRPTPAGQMYAIEKECPEYRERRAVRPGLTGLAQVRLGYTDELEGEYRKLQYDLRYIEGMSPALDLRILIATVRTVVEGTGGR
jgi:lipopolysaccharide/colanic/teichoic acid biosynthesis glycosyltransferase